MAANAARADRSAGDRKTERLHTLARTAVADRCAPVSLRQFAIIALFAEGARDWRARWRAPFSPTSPNSPPMA
jgi:hypothetical protein